MPAKSKGAAPLTPDLLARKGEAVSAARDTGRFNGGDGHFPDIGSDIRDGGHDAHSTVSGRRGVFSKRWLTAAALVLVVGAGAVGYFVRPEIEPVAEKFKAPGGTVSAEAVSIPPSPSVLPVPDKTMVDKPEPPESEGNPSSGTNAPATALVTASGPSATSVQAEEPPSNSSRETRERQSEYDAKTAPKQSDSAPAAAAITSVPATVLVAPAPPEPASVSVAKAPLTPAPVVASQVANKVDAERAAGIRTGGAEPAAIPTAPPVSTPKVARTLPEMPKTRETVAPPPTPQKLPSAPKAKATPDVAARVAPPVLPRPPKRPAVPVVAKLQPYLVQLVSVKSQAAAKREWARLKDRHAMLLRPLKASVQKAEVAKRGVFYRLRADGFATRREANALCAKLKAAGQGCLVVRR